MDDFWNNVFRYPRFFISSLIGLILVILSPLKNILKTSKSRFFIILMCFGFIIFLYITLKTMVGL